MENSTHRRLIRVLDSAEVVYRVIRHAPEGRTDVASEIRGHALGNAAKCMMLTLRDKKKPDRYVLAVVPGDSRVDYRKVKNLYAVGDVTLADRAVAETITGCQSGCVIPLSLDARFPVLLDSALLSRTEVVFNAARLDVSVALRPRDLLALSRPLVDSIAR